MENRIDVCDKLAQRSKTKAYPGFWAAKTAILPVLISSSLLLAFLLAYICKFARKIWFVVDDDNAITPVSSYCFSSCISMIRVEIYHLLYYIFFFCVIFCVIIVVWYYLSWLFNLEIWGILGTKTANAIATIAIK